MKRFTYTGSSSGSTNANNTLAGYTFKVHGAGNWHTLGIPGDTAWVDIRSLTVSTSGSPDGADTPVDCNINIVDAAAANTGTVRWHSVLRASQDYSRHFANIGMIRIVSNGLRIHISKPGPRAGSVVSCVYNCYTADEVARLDAKYAR